MEYPFNDDYMIFDEEEKQYKLTERALLEKCAIDIRARLAQNATISPEAVINRLIDTVSDTIYTFIHKQSAYNDEQDYFIAKVPELRNLMLRAMCYQVIYITTVGDLSLSEKKEDRAAAIDERAKSILNKTIRSLGTSILYAGGI